MPKMIRRSAFHLCVTLCGLTLCAASLSAQDRYFPLDPNHMPTGQASQWRIRSAPQIYGTWQPVSVTLPGSGTVTYFTGSPENTVQHKGPSQAAMMPGHTYRLRISDLADFPGIDLYPTIELLDRLHAPDGESQNFPIPIEITAEEIELVLQDRMVTKVVYLEQPDLAAPFDQTEHQHVEHLPVTTNLLRAADERGRPMAIVRLGGRIPVANSDRDEFYSRSPIRFDSAE